MKENIETSAPQEAEPGEPAIIIEIVASELFRQYGLDESRAGSFVSDVLSGLGVENAAILHRLGTEEQINSLLGILEDPQDEDEIGSLFRLDVISDDIKQHYGFPTSA